MAAERFSSIDPATGAEVWIGPAADAADVAAAIAAAREAFLPWAERPQAERVEVVRAFAAEIKAAAEPLATMISREMGKPLWESRTEVASVIGKVELSIRAQAERAASREEAAAFGQHRLEHRPHGVMAVFGPFNFPAHLPNGHIVPALLAGNTIVFKPSEVAPGVGEAMAAAWRKAGLPDGVLNLVQGGRDVGAALLDGEVDGVLFTGSVETGLHIHRRFAGRPDIILALEMGGNNPLIVWPPADAEAAASQIAHSAFLTSGQRCSCARRLIVPEGREGDAIVDAAAALAHRLRVGAAFVDPEPFMGPLAHQRAAARAGDFFAMLERLGGRAILRPRIESAFVTPAMIDMTGAGAPPDEELFGPLLQVFRVRSFDEALARAAATRFGLAGGLLGGDEALWRRARARLRIGVFTWNRPTTGASGAMPFGGPGLSGNHRPSAYYAADYCAWPMAQQAAPTLAAVETKGLV
jgi:succinylglutamic semialdehyde dehydrogenase